MVKVSTMSKMKIRPMHIILIAIVVILSCDDNFIIVKCEDCLESEPTEAKIELKVDDIGGYNTTLFIYEGNIGDSILLRTERVYGETMEFFVSVNKRYTFRVDYFSSNGVKYSAINSVYPRVKLDLEQCTDLPCYYIYDNKLNMRLKYL